MASKYLIRCSALHGLDHLVQSLGGESEPLLAPFGLCVNDLGSQQKTMALGDLVEVLETGARAFVTPDFGLRLAALQDFRMLGPLGLLLQNCHTLRESLQAVRGYMAFHNQSEYWDYQEYGELAIIRRYENFHDIAHTRQYRELSLGACFQLLRAFIGPGFRGERLEISHAPVSPPAVYQKYFKMDVHLNQMHDALVIRRTYLDQTLEHGSYAVKSQAAAWLNDQCGVYQHDVVQQVSTLVQQTLGVKDISLEHIAGLMHMNSRTLQRRLQQKGVVFRQLVNDIRIKTACWYLQSSTMDITLLSDILGYSDASGFSRAFRRAMGLSPRGWRAKNREAVNH